MVKTRTLLLKKYDGLDVEIVFKYARNSKFLNKKSMNELLSICTIATIESIRYTYLQEK